ncbi:MAG: hypothetical protein H8D56_06215 [Planctomycetes bacterium]|nr:hypothetical protein [Planctomycetota bacterium]
MIKPLKVTMIVYAVIGILFGLGYIFVPRQLSAMFGHDALPALAAALAAALGASFVSACIFLIIAARDPLKHILWVKYAIVFAILMLAAELYSVIMGYLTLGQAGTAIIIHAIIAAALLAFYPWRAARSGA